LIDWSEKRLNELNAFLDDPPPKAAVLCDITLSDGHWPFKVTHGHLLWHRSNIDFLLVNITKLYPTRISHRFRVIAVHWSDYRFWQGGAYI